MATRTKCSKHEVERTVVTCEGNFEPTYEMLIVKKQKHATAQPKLEGTREPPSSNCRKLAVSDAENPMRTLAKYVLQ